MLRRYDEYKYIASVRQREPSAPSRQCPKEIVNEKNHTVRELDRLNKEVRDMSARTGAVVQNDAGMAQGFSEQIKEGGQQP